MTSSPPGEHRSAPRTESAGQDMLGAMRACRLAALLAFMVSLLGCDAAEDADAGLDGATPRTDAGPPRCAPEPSGEPRALFELPPGNEEAFFNLPFPNDVRRTPEGTIDVTGFPNRRGNTFVARYLDAITQRIGGFATNGAAYVRFSHPVLPSSLPSTPEASIADDASIFLVDVDPESPERGARHPVVIRYQECATRWWPGYTVALRPVYGVPLASARRYALVVTDRVQPAEGGTFGRDADFDALVSGGGDDAVGAARAVYGDVFTVLAEHGIATDEVIAASVFTTQDAIGELLAIRDWMHAEYPAPTVVEDSVTVVGDYPGHFTELSGLYGPSPIFQEGEVPYTTEGGAIELVGGEPTVHGEFDARFTLTIPVGEMPERGYPIVLYAHGTGGSHRSFVTDDTAVHLAARGFAAMGVDQIHHNERNPTTGDPSTLFFNFPNPDAARDNNRQSALDVVQQARLIASLTFPNTGESAEARMTEEIRFDPTRVYFMGHSQGGLNGPIFLAIDDGARGGVLSAASGVLTPSLIHKLEPVPIPALVVALLGLSGGWQVALEREAFTEEHPIATLLQTWIEAADGSNYAHLIARSPREGFSPKSVLMTEGLLDPYTPPASIEALAGAMGAPLVEPVHQPVDSLRLLGFDVFAPPVTANAAGGMATLGLLQFPNDGHFAVFRNDVASAQVFGFFESLREGGPGIIPAP